MYVETNRKLHLCEDGVIVCPIHPQIDSMSNYPITTIRQYYPVEYSHMMHRLKEGIGKGDIIYSDIGEKQPILWACCHNAYNVSYKLEWVEKALKNIEHSRIHDKKRIFFPGLGFYQEDGIEQEDVLRLVYDYLNDGKYNIHFLTHY